MHFFSALKIWLALQNQTEGYTAPWMLQWARVFSSHLPLLSPTSEASIALSFFFSALLLWMPSFKLYLTTTKIALGFYGDWPFSFWNQMLTPQTRNLPLPKREHILSSFTNCKSLFSRDKGTDTASSHLTKQWQKTLMTKRLININKTATCGRN